MYSFLCSLDWLEIIQTVAACATVLAAFLAINTWKHQSKAQKQTNFLDELTDTVHEYIQALSRPREHLNFLCIGFECYRNSHKTSDGSLEQGVIAYIEQHGAVCAKSMWEYLEPSTKLVSKINSLVARGQVYGFTNYDQCRQSLQMLAWQHDRLQGVAAIVGSTNMNWNHPDVQKSITNMLTVKPDDVTQQLSQHNRAFLEFVNLNYKKIYAGT